MERDFWIVVPVPGYPRDQARGSAPKNVRTTSWRGMASCTTVPPRLTVRRRERYAGVEGSGELVSRWMRDQGRAQCGDGKSGEERRAPGEERFDWARSRQMEENAIFILFDLGCHFAEREDHRGGLGGSQCRMGQGVGAQGMVVDRGGARQQEPHGVGEKCRR